MGLVGVHPAAHDRIDDLGALLGLFKAQYGISEQVYGWLPTTNALMVVFFQVLVARMMKKYPDVQVMTWAPSFMFCAVDHCAFEPLFGILAGHGDYDRGNWWWCARSSAYAQTWRRSISGRIMSLYGLTWNVAARDQPGVGRPGQRSDRRGALDIQR